MTLTALNSAIILEVAHRSLFVRLPFVGEVYAGPLGIMRDSPAVVREARERFLKETEGVLEGVNS